MLAAPATPPIRLPMAPSMGVRPPPPGALLGGVEGPPRSKKVWNRPPAIGVPAAPRPAMPPTPPGPCTPADALAKPSVCKRASLITWASFLNSSVSLRMNPASVEALVTTDSRAGRFAPPNSEFTSGSDAPPIGPSTLLIPLSVTGYAISPFGTRSPAGAQSLTGCRLS